MSASTAYRALFGALAGMWLLASGLSGQTVMYLVRHAEPKLAAPGEDPSTDPHLNLAGRERAHALRHVLGQAGVTRIFSSDYNRTKETVGDLAEKSGLGIDLYDPRSLEAFSELLMRTPGRLVVAGHSNTTRELVALLGGEPGPPILENYEFDRLYQLVIATDGTITTSILRYGAASGS